MAPESLERIVAGVVAQVRTLLAPAPAPLPRLLSSAEVMELLGYAETEPFLRAARAAKCPMIRLNARKILFDPADVQQWLEKLKSAEPESRLIIESGSPLQRRRRRAAR